MMEKLTTNGLPTGTSPSRALQKSNQVKETVQFLAGWGHIPRLSGQWIGHFPPATCQDPVFVSKPRDGFWARCRSSGDHPICWTFFTRTQRNDIPAARFVLWKSWGSVTHSDRSQKSNDHLLKILFRSFKLKICENTNHHLLLTVRLGLINPQCMNISGASQNNDISPLNGTSKISRSTKNPGLISAEEAPSFNSVAATIRPSCAKETIWMVSSCMTSLQDPDPNITPNSSSLNMWTGKKWKNTIVVGQISENSQGSEIINGMGQKSPYVTLDAGVETQIEFFVVNGYEPPNAKQRLEVPSKHGSLQYAR